jgi:hypothetical protein
MLRITDRALDVLAEMRDLSGAEAGEVVVLYPEEDGGVGMGVGEPSPDDQIVERHGRPVVAVADELLEPFAGLVLDFVETSAETGEFALTRP